MSEGLGCFSCSGVTPESAPQPSKGSMDSLRFKDGRRTKVNDKTDPVTGIRTVSIDMVDQIDPKVELTAIPSAEPEAGTTINVRFVGKITPGSDPVVLRNLTGETDPTTDNVDITVNNVTSNISKTLSAKDQAGVTKSATAGVNFRYRFYIIFSTKESLSAEDIAGAGFLSGSSNQAFGGEKTYSVPDSAPNKHYIHWVYDTALLPIGVPVLGGLQVPLVKQGGTVTLANGRQYYVERTKNSYGGVDLIITI